MLKQSIIDNRANDHSVVPERNNDPVQIKRQLRPIAPKKLIRRTSPDRSQSWRRLIQVLFLLLNIWIGLQFWFFVRYFESGGHTIHASRPPGVEGWLPIAGLMNFKYFLMTGLVPSVHPAAMFLLIAFLTVSILLRKAFCSWLCPIGALSEALWKFGRELLKRSYRLPRWADLPLRSLKYLLLAFFVYAIAGMSASAIDAFQLSPYGLMADVKMLHFFQTLGETAAVVLAALVVLSIVVQNFWCRYLCPYGALMGLAAIFSPTRIHRDESKCAKCAMCARSCPALLKVDQLVDIRSAECTGCMECVAACPAEGALQLVFPKKRLAPAWLIAAGIAGILVVVIGLAKWRGTWGGNIPDSAYEQLVPQLDNLNHP